jgi:hypothetical protein
MNKSIIKHVTPNITVYKRYMESTNVATKSSYKNILKNRLKNGDSDAKKYLDKIEAMED